MQKPQVKDSHLLMCVLSLSRKYKQQLHLSVISSEVQTMICLFLLLLLCMQISERPEVSQAHIVPPVLPVKADQ